MSNNRKRMTALIIALIFAVGGAAAYMTDNYLLENTFNLGGQKVEAVLKEPGWEEPGSVAPGDEIVKNPTVELAAGSAAAWVRAKVTVNSPLAWSMVRGFNSAEWTINTSETTTADGVTTMYIYKNTGLTEAGQASVLFTGVSIPDDLVVTSTAVPADLIIEIQALQMANITQDLSAAGDPDSTTVPWGDAADNFTAGDNTI